MQRAIVVLGGYGNFGATISRALAGDAGARVVVAGRDLAKARALAARLGPAAEPAALDCRAANLARAFERLDASVVVHTSGPFQEQDYDVANACIDAGCHYVDIADARSYVAGIGALNERAAVRDVLVASGASSVPALSSAVIERYWPQFARLYAIRHGITSGAKPPGLATMQAVLGYVGKPFERWTDGRWQSVHGWQDLHARRYPAPVGLRWLAACDVPDLALFPRRYSGVQTVEFHAGLGFAATTLATWGLSWLVRSGALASLAPQSRRLHALAARLEPFGTQWSAMHVELDGFGRDGAPLRRTWELLAGSNHGPTIPCLPAIALARKLVGGAMTTRGAMPCVGLLTVDEILGAVPALDLRVVESPT